MKANLIKINPHTKEVSQVDIESGDLESYYQEIGCSTFDCVGISKLDAIFCDDEALLQDEQPPAFSIDGRIIYGIGLVAGVDEEGNTISPNHSIKEIEEKVVFLGHTEWLEPTITVIPFVDFEDLFFEIE